MFEQRIIDLFWSHVEKTDTCWIWNSTKTKDGYGIFRPGSSIQKVRRWRAHRFSWFIASGEIPGGWFVCHHCDNPICVNPNHLFLGTCKDNIRDCWIKGRGNKNGTYKRTVNNVPKKINITQAEEIRLIYSGGHLSQKEIGKRFNISAQNVSNIVLRKTWSKIISK